MRREPRMQAAAMLMATGLLAIVPALLQGGPSHPTAVLVQDFEKVSSLPTVWVVNIPNENASVTLSTDHPHGEAVPEAALPFPGGTVPVPRHPQQDQDPGAGPSNCAYLLNGDNSKCSYGVQVSDASGETHQFSKNTGQGGLIDFTGWKESRHRPGLRARDLGRRQERQDRLSHHRDHVHHRPAHRRRTGIAARRRRPLFRCPERRLGEERRRDLGLPGFRALAGLLLRRQRRHARHPVGPGLQERDREMLEAGRRLRAPIPRSPQVALDAQGNGSFVFPADAYPHGPIMVRNQRRQRLRQG